MTSAGGGALRDPSHNGAKHVLTRTPADTPRKFEDCDTPSFDFYGASSQTRIIGEQELRSAPVIVVASPGIWTS